MNNNYPQIVTRNGWTSVRFTPYLGASWVNSITPPREWIYKVSKQFNTYRLNPKHKR